jgi:hypothetical protein
MMENYSTIEKNEIISFTGKWMELENFMLNKISQVQKNKGHMFFPNMWKLDLKDKCVNKYISDLIYIATHMYL